MNNEIILGTATKQSQIKVGMSQDHSKQYNLEYEKSGHIGFQKQLSEEQISAINNAINMPAELDKKADKTELPKKISDLEDDTSSSGTQVKWAKESLFSNHAKFADNTDEAMYAVYDSESNNISETYATKAELTEAIGEALEADY